MTFDIILYIWYVSDKSWVKLSILLVFISIRYWLFKIQLKTNKYLKLSSRYPLRLILTCTIFKRKKSGSHWHMLWKCLFIFMIISNISNLFIPMYYIRQLRHIIERKGKHAVWTEKGDILEHLGQFEYETPLNNM